MRPTGPIRAHICGQHTRLSALPASAYASYAPDIPSESFSVFAKDCYVKACARLDLYALTSAGNIRDYLRSHAYASAYASYAPDIPSESFSVFAKDCYVKACARLDLYALTSACNIRDYLRSHTRLSALFKSSHMQAHTLAYAHKCAHIRDYLRSSSLLT